VKIFERLHPIELYNLIRTTKSIRKLLLNQEAWSIWHRSYAKHKEVPSCPSDTSYPRWTTLLFGPDDCDVSYLCIFDDLETEEICIRNVVLTTQCRTLHFVRTSVNLVWYTFLFHRRQNMGLRISADAPLRLKRHSVV